MNFIDQEDEYNIPFTYEDDIIFPQFYQNIETPEHSKSTDDLEQRFKNDRKERILKKRIEKKQKTKTDKSLNLSKDELRKLRNRNSAQQSRDKKKQQFDNLMQENLNYQQLLKQKDDIILQLTEENHQLRQRLAFMEETNQHCGTEPELIRVNVITKQKMMSYGLMSLLAITCILSIVNNDYTYTQTPISLQQISNQKYDFLAKPSYSNSTQIAPYNSLAIPDHSFNNQTLFYNCTGNEKECQTFLNIIKAENADNIYFVNDATDHLPTNQDHHFNNGENVYLIKIKQDDEDNFMIFRAKCQITESNNLIIERNSYDSYNNDSLQY